MAEGLMYHPSAPLSKLEDKPCVLQQERRRIPGSSPSNIEGHAPSCSQGEFRTWACLAGLAAVPVRELLYLVLCLPFKPGVCSFVCLSVPSSDAFVCLRVCLFVSRSVCLSVCLSRLPSLVLCCFSFSLSLSLSLCFCPAYRGLSLGAAAVLGGPGMLTKRVAESEVLRLPRSSHGSGQVVLQVSFNSAMGACRGDGAWQSAASWLKRI